MKIPFLSFGLALAVTASAQYDPCNQCGKSCEEACGPNEVIRERKALLGEALQKAPYSYILHREISRGGSPNYSTGSFIAPHVLITAHHNVMGNVRRLAFCNKSVDADRWVRFKKNEVKIVHLGRVDAPTDISLILFKNPSKIAPLHRGHFKPTDQLPASGTQVHLTGFSCDKPDTLLDKHIAVEKLALDPKYTLAGYLLYTCTGDSGAPLWYIDADGVPCVTGIHHGGKEGYFPSQGEINISARITAEVLGWLGKY